MNDAAMFGGYAEVAAYYTDTDLAGQCGMAGDSGPLPTEYIPQSISQDPWHTDAVCQKDFVLVAEFSEQEGPKPLITIPRNISNSLDLNEFSVQILSVDYQTSSGPKFNLCEDKQVLTTDSKKGISSFVHHFTLYDSQARGFVRPFCMAYVTPDTSKLMSFYDELCAEFAQVSHCFKYGNRHLFVRDMTHYLSDLHYTKERYLERRERNTGESEDEERAREEKVLSTVHLPTLDNIICEVKHILETTSALPEDEELEMRFSVLEETASSHHGNTSEQTQLSFENFHYSCSLHSNDTHLSQLDHKQLRRSESSCEMEETWSPHPTESYKPKVVRTTKKRFEKSLRSLHELCRWGAKEGLNRLRSLQTYFSRDRAVLHIERKDAAAIDPSSGLLTIGRNVQLNLLCANDMFEAHTPLHGHHCSLVSSPSCLLPHRTHSDETLGSFHSAESFLSCVDDTSSLTSDPVSIPANSSSDSKDMDSAGECVSTEDDTHKTPSDPLSVPLQANNTMGASSSGSSLSSSQGHEPQDGLRQFTVVRPGRLEFHSVPVVSVVSSADHVNNLNSHSPGYGLLRLVHQFSFTPALLYGLLCGRPLVVLGSPKQERDVRSAVTALSLFVTGHSGEDVVGWRTRPVRLADITLVKLMGVGRTSKKSADSMVPSSVQRYVSILNLEKKTLWAPPYEGGVLTDVYSKRRVFKKEQPYIYFIHSVLYELSQKALLYYHAFSTSEVAATNSFTGVVSIQERQLYVNISACFCSKLRLSNADMSIVKHFVAMVQKQQVSDLQQNDGADSPQHSVMLDYRQCSLFKVT